jgi:Immunity protein Imm1
MANGIDLEEKMRKLTHFASLPREGWPKPKDMERYFLGPPGQRWNFEERQDCWGLTAEGLHGTERLAGHKGRIDIRLTMVGNPERGVLLQYRKVGREYGDVYYSKQDLKRLKEWVMTHDGDLMPIGLFVPFERAWVAVKEFMDKDGALPQSIAWIAARDVPDYAFPDPGAREPAA